MRNQFWLSVLLLCGVWLGPATAQGLAKTYVAADGSFQFAYPTGFTLAEGGDPPTLRATALVDDIELTIAIFGPQNDYLPTASLNFDGTAERLSELVMLYATPYRGSSVGQAIINRNITLRVGERDAALLGLFRDGEQIFLYAIEFDDGQFGVMVFESGLPDAEAQRGFYEAILGSFNGVDAEGQAQAANNATAAQPSVAAPPPALQLAHDAGRWSEAVAELQSLGLIASTGGTLILTQDDLSADGMGETRLPLAAGAARTHIVMAGTLAFMPQSPTGYETCSLLARTDEADEPPEVYLQIGLDSDGDFFYVDRSAADDEAPFVYQLLGLDLAQAHRLLLILQEDRLTVFVNGESLLVDTMVEEREGFFGMAYAGASDDSRCDIRDLWVYASPPFTPGLCTASAPSPVNKRTGPGTNFERMGQLIDEPLAIIAQTTGTDGFVWYQLEDESYVRQDVIALSGDCSAIPAVEGA